MMADDGDTTYCSNCKRDIATSNFVMHEIHCRRHIVLCEHCQEPVPRSELEEHFTELHAKVSCDLCQMSLSKDRLEHHMDNDCPKKLMACEFCDLTVPQMEHESHIGYCGSRTEPCPLCQQFIMLKDMRKHEESLCTFPEPKPVPVTSNQSDAFNMEELQYMLDQEFNSTNSIPDFSSNLRQELTRTRRQPPRPKLANSDMRRNKNSVGKKSNTNGEKPNNLASQTSGTGGEDWRTAIPPDMDYDTMLALQMAHEDWQWEQEPSAVADRSAAREERETRDDSFSIEELMNHVRQNNEPRLPPPALESHSRQQTAAANEYTDDDMCIPCEFCDVDIPLNSYLTHAESCPMGEGAQDNRNIPAAAEPHSRAAIPVINNLRTNDLLVNSVNTAPPPRDSLDEIVLPCEFCEELFPADIIFQHQNVCPSNGMVTPRATTPNVNLRPSNITSTQVGTKKPQRQHSTPPGGLIDFVDDNRFNNGAAHSNHSPSDNFFPSRKVSTDSPIDKYRPGLNRFDDAMTRPPRRTPRQPELLAEVNIGDPANGAAASRPSKSAQRARARLNQLLQEESIGASAAGAVGDRRKTATNGHLDKNKPGNRRDQRTQVSTRTVMNQLDRPSQRKETNSRPAAQQSNGASASRRQRGDHVFSPELRVKPPPNSKK